MDGCCDHGKDEFSEKKKNLVLAILSNGVFTLIELFVGIFSGSLALLSDALHDFTDTTALLLSYFTHVQSKKAPSGTKTFGYQRATIIAAFINGSVLLVLSLFLLYRAYARLLEPQPVKSLWLVFTAVAGLIFNGFIVHRLHRHSDDLNMRSVWWHMVEDMLSWLAVLIGGALMYFTGWYIIDPLLSIVISLVVLYGGYRLLQQTVNVLLEGVPSHIDLGQVQEFLEEAKGVKGVHDLHVWSLGSQSTLLSCHIVTNKKTLKESSLMVNELRHALHKRFDINHCTIEAESEHCGKGC